MITPLLIFPLFLFQTVPEPVDNLTVFNRMAAMVMDSVINELSLDSSATVIIRRFKSEQEEGNWWIENWFAKRLTQQGISQILLNPQSSDSGLVIEFKILALKVEYYPTHERRLIERRFNFNLTVRAFEPATGSLQLFHEFSKHDADRVMIKDAKKFENKDFSFTQATLPEHQGVKKYIEPVIIMVTTAGVIYLFFRLRSN